MAIARVQYVVGGVTSEESLVVQEGDEAKGDAIREIRRKQPTATDIDVLYLLPRKGPRKR